MSVYQSNALAAPDELFEPGALSHLVVGNGGRLLDPRRTPVTIVEIRPATGIFVVRLDDFEDRGATWEMPFEKVDRFQFARGAARASPQAVHQFQQAIRQFDRPLRIDCDPGRCARTKADLDQVTHDASRWLMANSTFLAENGELPDPETRLGDPRLFDDLERYFTDRDLWDIEQSVAVQYVRNPDSGEMIKGHRMVIAEMGLVPFNGTIVRDEAVFANQWSRDRRRAHVLARLSFMRALFAQLGRTHIVLYRGISTRDPLRPPGPGTFISASFSRAVAESHFNVGEGGSTRALFRQVVSVDRLFMSYLETRAMNEHYREAEAVLLCERGTKVF